MPYFSYSIKCKKEDVEVLTAHLFDIGFEGFEENEEEIIAYIDQKTTHKSSFSKFESIITRFSAEYCSAKIEDKNWNEEWEKSYQPIELTSNFYVRAPFHPENTRGFAEIIISPKMAFGTGHHSTTRLVAQLQEKIDFNHKKVLDYGTGTGLLAFIAEKLGASEIIGIDNDPLAIDCSIENVKLNNLHKTRFFLSDLKNLKFSEFDIILANITRNTIIDSAELLSSKLKHEGSLIASGFIENDCGLLINHLSDHGFHFQEKITENGWAACYFIKKHL